VGERSGGGGWEARLPRELVGSKEPHGKGRVIEEERMASQTKRWWLKTIRVPRQMLGRREGYKKRSWNKGKVNLGGGERKHNQGKKSGKSQGCKAAK